ncbi:uncharacterized protein LOC110474669 [Lonchura striata]
MTSRISSPVPSSTKAKSNHCLSIKVILLRFFAPLKCRLRKLLKEGWTTGHLYVHPAVCIQNMLLRVLLFDLEATSSVYLDDYQYSGEGYYLTWRKRRSIGRMRGDDWRRDLDLACLMLDD